MLSRTPEPTKRTVSRGHGPEPVHFLHIGKTGGSAIKHAIGSAQEMHPGNERLPFAVLLHRHSKRLGDVPEGEKFFFFVRDPLSRFVSGFWSRQRQGQPRYFAQWNEAERDAFGRFRTPGELAIALSSPSAEEKGRAESAMRNIRHVRDGYWRWFNNEEYFLSRLDDLFFIGFQSRLSDDFEVLKSRLRLPGDLMLPDDDVRAHVTPSHLDRRLGDVALRNLQRWYREDFEFLDLCRSVIVQRPLVRAARQARY